MCCLKNEQETYEYLNSRLPSVGDTVITPLGLQGEVSGINVMRQLVKVIVDNGEEKELQEYSVDELRFTPRRRKDIKLTEEELKELEGLEDSGESVEEKPQRERRDSDRKRENRNNRKDHGGKPGNRSSRKEQEEQKERRENRRYDRNYRRNNRRNYDKRNNQDESNRGE